MNFISREEEAVLIAQGEKPHMLAGHTEFEVRDTAGLPTGRFCKIYKVDPISGLGSIALTKRTMTPEEMDSCEMRNPDGSVQAITYGEYRKRSTANVST